jgi:hypothetical protein
MPPPAGVATAGQPGEGGDVDTDEDEALWQAVDPPTAMDVDTTSTAAAVPEQRQITGGRATPPAGDATAGRQGDGKGNGRAAPQPGDPGFCPNWPRVPCTSCGGENSTWRTSWPTRVYTAPDTFHTTWECPACWSRRHNMPENEGLKALLMARPDWREKQSRREAFSEAQKNILESVDGIDSKKRARTLTRKALCKVFAPMMSIIARKLRQISKRHEFMDERDGLVKRLEEATDPAVISGILDELERIEEAVEKKSEPLAFAHVVDPFEKARWLLAAQYSDTWTEIRSKSGRVCAGFVTFYVCMRDWGAGERCYSLIVNKRWDLLHKDDPLQAGQRRSLLAELGAFMSCASRPMEHSEVQSLERSCHMLHGIWSTAKRRLWSACVG